MATRAERFRAEAQRSGPKRPKTPQRGSSHKALARNATYALETTAAPGTPSRKSTRRSKHRQKAATTLTSRVELQVSSPARRHLNGK
jgi:hypothetical protein